MSSLTSRSIVLSFARVSNLAVLLFSPVLLVRILDIETYGIYREFVLYALLAVALITPGIKPNLLYFIPLKSKNEKIYVQHTILLLFAISTIVLSIVLLSQNLIIDYISFDYILLLVAYVFLYINLDIIEPYWLAKKRTDYVFFYSTGMQIIRITAIVTSAYLSKDITTIIQSMVAVEIAKFTLLAIWWFKKLNPIEAYDKQIANHQISYIAPFAVGILFQSLNLRFGSIFVATYFGAASLAIYTIGLYQIPVLNIIRSSVSDVIFPDMVKDNQKNGIEGLSKWQHANIIFCFAVFPTFIIFWIFSEKFITTLFTTQYIDAIPIFKVMLVLMVWKCFEFGSPLRAKNKNKYFLSGNIFSLIFNIIFTFLTYKKLGLMAPAIAFLLSDLLVTSYLCSKVIKIYNTSLKSLFLWKKIILVTTASIIGAPILYLADLSNSATLIIISLILYCFIYYKIIRKAKMQETEAIILKLHTIINNKILKARH